MDSCTLPRTTTQPAGNSRPACHADRNQRSRPDDSHSPHTTRAGKPRMSVRVVIADDQELIRTGFRMILFAEPDIEVVGEASNGEDAITATRELPPDGVTRHIQTPALDRIHAPRQILA